MDDIRIVTRKGYNMTPTNKQPLFIVTGASGVGKSSACNALFSAIFGKPQSSSRRSRGVLPGAVPTLAECFTFVGGKPREINKRTRAEN